MSEVTLKGGKVNLAGNLPQLGSKVEDFKLVAQDLSEKSLKDYASRRKVLSIFPSLDTAVCAMSVRTFNGLAAALEDTIVLNISADLPFAHKRFCVAEGIENVHTLSSFRSDFGKKWGLEIMDSSLKGLLARAVVVLDENDKVIYSQLVQEITTEPDYDAALKAIKS
jgi:thiol peroxidase